MESISLRSLVVDDQVLQATGFLEDYIEQSMDEILIQAPLSAFFNGLSTNVFQPMWLHHRDLTPTFQLRNVRTELHTVSNHFH
jgi:hypothetical protein